MSLATSKTSCLSSTFLLWALLAFQFMTACLAQDSLSSNAVVTASTTLRSASSSTTSAPLQTHTIQVGLADHRMVPNVTRAAIGDTLEFRFFPLNHSVARAEYLMPCIPYEMSGPGKTGFFTGFHPVSAVLDDPPSYSVRVNDTNPIFFYCSAPGSCINYGMVGAVNPSEDQDIEQQHQKAKDSTYMLNPGESFPAEGEPDAGYGGINGTGAGDGGGTVADTKANSKSSLSPGAIAGIVIGGIAVLVLAALVFFFWGRTKSLEDEVDRKAGTLRRISSSSRNKPLHNSDPTQTPHSPPPTTSPSTNGGLATLGYPFNNPPDSSPAMSEILQHQHHQHHPTHQTGYSTPAPAYHTHPAALPYKFDLNTPTGHPAYPPLSSSPAPFELAHHPSRTVSPPPQPYPNTPPTHSPAPPHDTKFLYSHYSGLEGGGLALQSAGAGTGTQVAPAPSYFESVQRPGVWHFHGGGGLVEM
ncbi:hypothetical protein IAQ61_002318, partial [Plenodomus lingam]|uniref:uncharacterized protein n=1 Tax=Leptosphaeria maculans TaxID=5022 RepID=UPI00331675C2